MFFNRAALEAALETLNAFENEVGDTKIVIVDSKEFIGAFNSEINAQDCAPEQQTKLNAEHSAVQAAKNAAISFEVCRVLLQQLPQSGPRCCRSLPVRAGRCRSGLGNQVQVPC